MSRLVEVPVREYMLYDTTGRDGNQTPFGPRLDVDGKLTLVQALAREKIPFIEAGWPGSGPVDNEFFKEAKGLDLGESKLVAFSMTGRVGVSPENDNELNLLLNSGTDLVAVFGKSWMLHVTDALKTTGPKNVETIRRTIEFLTSQKREVHYDAEHFFDGFREDPEYAIETLLAAKAGGASTITLCDTRGNGGSKSIYEATLTVRERLGEDFRLGIHVHNDRGLALPNTLEAMRAGATLIQGVINLGGERAGNVDLIQVVNVDTGDDFDPAVELGFIPVIDFDRSHTQRLSDEVARITGRPVPENYPHTGKKVHSDTGGTHRDGTGKNFRANHIYDPKVVGAKYYIINSDQGGGANVVAMAEKHGFPLTKNDPEVALLREDMKDLQDLGDAQEYLMLYKRCVRGDEPFEVIDRRIDDEWGKPSQVWVKVRVNGDVYEESAQSEGGLINAFDLALRKALSHKYPEVEKVGLVPGGYKNTSQGGRDTSATVTVEFELSDGEEVWNTKIRGKNQQRAGEDALIDGYKYYILQTKSR